MKWQSFPAMETTQVSLQPTLLIKSALRPSRYTSQEFILFILKTVCQTLLKTLHSSTSSCVESSAPWASLHITVTMILLRQIKEEIARAPDFLPSDKLMLWSAFTLAYGFLRSNKFTSPSATQFNPLVHLCFTDISFTFDGCLTLHLKSLKTDPYRQGWSLLIAPSLHSVCAMQALTKYLPLCSISGTSPLYVFQSGAYLTRAKVTLTLRTLLQRLSIPTELYASHSFRIGAATTAAEAGLSPWLIQTLGRWSKATTSPHLSFHSLSGGVCASLVGSSITLQGVWLPPLFHYSLLGCVAATLIALLIIARMCRCHPSCSHFAECVAAIPI